MMPTAAHWMPGCPFPVATNAVKTEIRIVIAIAPYSNTERRPTRSTVKYSGTQPRAKKMLRTPLRRETREGFATVERMTLPISRLATEQLRGSGKRDTVVCDER